MSHFSPLCQLQLLFISQNMTMRLVTCFVAVHHKWELKTWNHCEYKLQEMKWITNFIDLLKATYLIFLVSRSKSQTWKRKTEQKVKVRQKIHSISVIIIVVWGVFFENVKIMQRKDIQVVVLAIRLRKRMH